MKQNRLAAPLLGITLLFILFNPFQNNTTASRLDRLTTQSYAASLKIAAQRIDKKPPGASQIAPEPDGLVLPPVGVETDGFSLDLDRFIAQVSDDQTRDSLRGVHVAGALALRVEQQPVGEAIYVSSLRGVATQFRSAAQNGVTGLLAHNYLSGKLFYRLKLGQEVHLVYGSGALKSYRVAKIERYQKLDPGSLRSDLIELRTGKRLTTDQVFKRYYSGSDHVTFQTCLANEGISNWGLTFIVAEPEQ